MTHTPKITRRLLLAGLSLFFAASQLTHAAEIRVITSGAFTEAYKKLVPAFEKQTGHHVISAFGASVGNAPDSIPTRFSRGEKFDLVILSDGGLEALVKNGNVIPGSRVDLVRSQIGAAVRKGTPKPDISTVEALKQTCSMPNRSLTRPAPVAPICPPSCFLNLAWQSNSKTLPKRS